MSPSRNKKGHLRVKIPLAGKMKIETNRKEHAGDKSHQCNLCDKVFLRIGDFKRHLMSHAGEKPFKCNQCEKAFGQNSHLKGHIKIHTGERPYKCSECDKGFIQKSELIRHHRVHTGEKPYHCSECEKSFSGKTNLEDHMRKHTGKTKEKHYQCKHCDKAFVQNRELIDHQRTHTGDKPYKCTLCEKSFSLKCNLICHERIHTGEKPYKCKYCEKCFVSKNDLGRHTLVHTQEKAYKCTHCDMVFSQNGNLTRHLMTHTGEKPYKCTQCEKTFTTNHRLIFHYRLHTGETPYKCSDCDKSYSDNGSLKLHLKIHTGEKPHKCTYCTKAFSTKGRLKIHINIHTLENVYTCSQCNASFSQNCNLKTHMRRKHTDQEESDQSSHSDEEHQDTFLDNSLSQKSIHINHLKTHTSSSGVWMGSVKQCHDKTTDCTTNQNPESEGDNISDEITTGDHSSIPLFCDDSTKVLLWFQQNKLLKSALNCDSCCNVMNWSETSRSRDGFHWICQTKGCLKYQHSECIKLGSFFDNSRVTLPDWFDIIYLWSENVKAKVTSNMVDISHKHIIDCYASLRAVCCNYFIENPIKLGGPGISIEIDVARFSGILKNNQGKSIMVLGIIDSNSSPLKGYMEIVESSDATTILPILLKVVEPGSIIYSKESKDYQKMHEFSKKDKIVKHSLDFLDMNSSEDDTNIASFWDRHTTYINTIYDCKQNNLNSYFQELSWRDRFNDDSFKRLCQHISAQYPL